MAELKKQLLQMAFVPSFMLVERRRASVLGGGESKWQPQQGPKVERKGWNLRLPKVRTLLALHSGKECKSSGQGRKS